MNAKSAKKPDAVDDALHAINAGAEKSQTETVKNEAPARLPERTPLPPKAATPVTAPRPKKHTSDMRFRLRYAGELHNVWDETCERGTTLEDIKQADYWKHVARRMRPHDEIIAIAEDGSFRAHLFVNSCDVVWAVVTVLEYKDMTNNTDRPKTQEEEYDVTYTSFSKWGVRKKGNEGLPALKDGFATRIEAYQWLDGHLRTLNA